MQFQRNDYKRNHLSADRIEPLEKIGFQWYLRYNWPDGYKLLIEFLKLHDHCNVPKIYKSSNHVGIFVQKQRLQYRLMKEAKKSKMTTDRVKKLGDVGFEWNLK